MTIAEELALEQKIGEVVRGVVEKFSPEVVRARFQFEEDWMGEPVLYVRVTLRAAAIRGGRLSQVAGTVREYVCFQLRAVGFEGVPSVRFRGLSVGKRTDPKWA